MTSQDFQFIFNGALVTPLVAVFSSLCFYAINADSFPATSCLSRSQNGRGRLCNEEIFHAPPSLRLGSFSNDDCDGNEDLKKAIGMMSKTTTVHVHHAFLYSSLLSLYDYDVKMLDSKLYGGPKQGMANFYFLILNLSAVPK